MMISMYVPLGILFLFKSQHFSTEKSISIGCITLNSLHIWELSDPYGLINNMEAVLHCWLFFTILNETFVYMVFGSCVFALRLIFRWRIPRVATGPRHRASSALSPSLGSQGPAADRDHSRLQTLLFLTFSSTWQLRNCILLFFQMCASLISWTTHFSTFSDYQDQMFSKINYCHFLYHELFTYVLCCFTWSGFWLF